MKFQTVLLALCFGHGVAFSVTPTLTRSSVALRSSRPEDADVDAMFVDLPLTRIEGEGTVATYKMPLGSERCQYEIRTNGRPLKAKVELWVGPIRTTHTMIIDNQDGSKTPYKATLKFKKGDPTLKISTTSNLEFPVLAGVKVATAERCEELGAITQRVWDSYPKVQVQGGSTEGGGGAIRTFPIDTNVESVQVLFWSKNTGKKSLRAQIEVYQGPNNKKQVYTLQCGGGSQPYHAIIETPGEGVNIRIQNKKFIEDGLFEVAVIPYRVSDKRPTDPTIADSSSSSSWWSGS